ncbi:MAG: OmpA family protein [Treponema sp.]|jgi:outer membrane protein OmpA-like peptidoglycan-associated protein|nr:OmpA family protein [Treponema sp.]
MNQLFIKNFKLNAVLRLFLIIVIAFSAIPLWPEEFIFKHKTGDKFKTISTSREDVFMNGQFLHSARILNKMSSEVIDEKNGIAIHKALFQLAEERESEDGKTKNFQWTEEYDSVFGRDGSGKITIENKYVMPTVRNVPVFPDRQLKTGDSWEADGYEAHDLGPVFAINELYRLPFTAKYTFLGEREWRGKLRKAISIAYTVDDRQANFLEDAPLDIMNQGYSLRGKMRVTGESSQIVYWDSELGQPVGAEEDFKLKFEMPDGDVYEFKGKAEAEIMESSYMDKNAVANDILRDMADEGIDGAEVKVVKEGVKINLEDIMFEPETAILVDGEEKKLEKIGELLRKYPDRDIMIGGHAAKAGGTEESRTQLSQERAARVAAYFIEHGVRDPGRIIARGYGSKNPIADNNTEAGRRKNRRVEIIILEN